MAKPYLFDSHAILAFLQNEKEAETVATILRSCLERTLPRLMCMINLGEVIYLTKRRFGDEKKLEVLAHIHRLGFELISVTDALVFQAAEYKAQYPLSYADSFAVACAVNNGAILVTGDPEFKAVEHLVQVHWTPPA